MPCAAPHDLLRIAREERARRKAAWAAAGQGLSDRAAWDDVLWSNIEHMAGRHAGDRAALCRPPHYWTAIEREQLMANARATLAKAIASLDAAIPANAAKIIGLRDLAHWLAFPLLYTPAPIERERTVT
jgi:hypothetical protein